MSKNTNDGLTQSGTGCFIAVRNIGRQRVNHARHSREDYAMVLFIYKVFSLSGITEM